MADPEINIAVKADTSQAESALKHLENTVADAAGAPADTQGSDTLAAGIGRLANACEKGADRIQKLDLGYLHYQFDELKGINAEMGGLGNALDDFGTRLADISSRQAETAEGFRSLHTDLTRLSEAYKSGKISANEAAASLAELTDCAAAQLATNKQLRADVRRLEGEQEKLVESMREELPIYRQMQAAAKEELATFEATSEKKAQLRALEKASLDELYQKVEAYEAKAADARTSGDAVSELEAAKAIEATIKVIEKKEAAQQRADQTAQAGLERTERAIVLQHASVERLARLYDAVRQKYLEAKQAQDVQGEAQYLQYAKQVSDALNKKQQEADRAARALEQSSKAAEKEAAAQEAAARQMQLSSMKARELTAEIERLSAARKEAAAAGNTTEYEKVTGDLVRAKKALSEYNNEVNISKSALLNKAQAGMMAAQQLGGLAQQVRSGTVDMAAMANTIMSVSLALKAGLGPIGWAMMALQGLQLALDAYTNSCNEAAKQQMEANEKALEGWMRARKMLNEAAKSYRDSLLDGLAERTMKGFERAKEATTELADESARALKQAQLSAETKLKESVSEREREKESIRTRAAISEIDKEDARQRIAAIDEEIRALKKAYAEEQDRQTVAAAKGAKERAAKEAEEMQNAFNKEYQNWKEIIEFDIPNQERIKFLEAELLRRDEDDEGFKDIEKELKAYYDKVRTTFPELAEKLGGIESEKGWKGALEFVLQLQTQAREQQKVIEEKRKEVAACEKAVRQAEELVAENGKRREIEQKAAAAKEAANDSIASYTEAEKKRQEEWKAVSDKSYSEQERWLSEQLASMREGSELWKKYNDQLQDVRKSHISDELGKLDSELKSTGNYARQSGKTQAQVYREDLRILQEKEKQLEQLRTAPGIDAKTEERINRALQSTREQISGLKSAMAQSAANARRWIRETEPPKLQGKNKVVQGSLDRLAKTYRLTAARAAKAAEKGDWKAYERAMRTMGNAEKNMGKLAKDSKQVAGYTGAMKKNVKAIADAARSGARSEKDADRAAKQKAAAQKKAAAAIEKQRPKEKVEDAAQKIAELSSKMNSAREQMERLSQQVAALQGAIGGLASAAGSAADAAGNVASAANSAIKSVERRIKACEKSIDKLRR